MPKTDYQHIVVPVVEELIGLAGFLVPQPSVKEVKVLTDVEGAELNTERIVLVRKLLEEVKHDTTCPSCVNKVDEIERQVHGLEKTIVTQERVSRLRENLQKLLEEAREELPFREAEQEPAVESKGSEVPPPILRPETGRTYASQTGEAYCLECVEGHTMRAQTELRHAIDRYRTAGKMTEGVTEKVRVAIRELLGINEDVKDTKSADPQVKAGLDEILDKARWVGKEYGVGGKGLTAGQGGIEDLEALRREVDVMQATTYKLVAKCPTCLKRIA